MPPFGFTKRRLTKYQNISTVLNVVDTDAEKYERQLLLQKDAGEKAKSRAEKNLTFLDYWKLWANECRAHVSVGWKTTQDQMAKKYILPFLGAKKLVNIQPQEIRNILDQARKLNLAPQTVLHIYNLLHKVFDDCVEEYMFLNSNPVRKKYRPHVPEQHRKYLKPNEAKVLLQYSRDELLAPAIWIGILSGLRPGEVQALRKRDVDFVGQQIYIRATYSRKSKHLQPYPKQKHHGRAPMPPPLAEFLRMHLATKADDDFVVNSPHNEMLRYSYFLKQLRKLCREAGVTVVTPHELRHSAGELYIEMGATAEDLRRLLNHQSLSVTKKYIHRTDERLHGIASLISLPDDNDTPPQKLKLVK